MGGNLAFSGVTGLRIFYLSNREGLAVLLAEVVLRELINPIDVELTPECLNAVSGLELITGPVVVTNVFQPWLSNVKVFREALSLKKHGKVITPIVVVMDLSHFSGVVSEEVVDDVGRSSKRQKNLKTRRSLSRNCFWLLTRPPPRDFSMYSFRLESWNFSLGI